MTRKSLASYLSDKNIPQKYSYDIHATTIIKNLYKFINYFYEGEVTKFKKDYKTLLKLSAYTESEIESKIDSFNKKWRNGRKGDMRKFNNEDANLIIKCFELPAGCLFFPEKSREVAYILIECLPNKVNTIFDFLIKEGEKDNSLIDECALLSGNADLFVRVHGSREEIKELIISMSSKSALRGIRRTSTHFSFANDVWQKYPVSLHQHWKPKKPYWLDDRWTLPKVL